MQFWQFSKFTNYLRVCTKKKKIFSFSFEKNHATSQRKRRKNQAASPKLYLYRLRDEVSTIGGIFWYTLASFGIPWHILAYFHWCWQYLTNFSILLCTLHEIAHSCMPLVFGTPTSQINETHRKSTLVRLINKVN